MDLNSSELQTLIAQAKANSQPAFKKLMEIYWPYVYGYQLKHLEDEYLAEDISIQTFSKAFDKIETYKENYGFKTWLISISKNLHIDFLRREKRHSASTTDIKTLKQLSAVPDENLSVEDELIKEQNLNQLLKDIKQLKPHYQQVINLRYFQELSYKEIADALNEPVNTIKVKLLRAKKLLAEIISTQ